MSTNSYLIEIFKNHKLMKIFQKKSMKKDKYIYHDLKKLQKINEVFVRALPIMEFLTGIMIAFLIFISAKLISNDELEVSNFFSFLAAMMLAYQPVRSLATLNISIQQGLSGARRVLPIIDDTPTVKENENSKELIVNDAQIKFKNIKFEYYKDQKGILKSINLNIPGKKMTALVGHSGAKIYNLKSYSRFYNKWWHIIIDDQSIYNSTIYSLRKNIS